MKKYFYLLFLPFLFSCQNRTVEQAQPSNTQTINVPSFASEKPAMFEDHFSSWKIIPLETNKKSVIGVISRISVHKGEFFVLDKKTNSVLMFDSKGKFLNRIQRNGNGPGEYVGLQDFAIDAENDRLILYAHRPYKLLFFDLKGNYQGEKRLNRLYDFISFSSGNLLLLNSSKHLNFLFNSADKDGNIEKNYMTKNAEDAMYFNFRLRTPYLLRGRTTNIFFPYSDTVYQYNKGVVEKKFKLDFGVKNFDAKMKQLYYGKKMKPMDVYKLAVTNEYGYAITNFKETADHIFFTYSHNIIVMYNKKTKEVVRCNSIANDKTSLSFKNLFAHDGDDNDMIALYQAFEFKSDMKALAEDAKMWSKVPADIKALNDSTSLASNPLLLIYTLK